MKAGLMSQQCRKYMPGWVLDYVLIAVKPANSLQQLPIDHEFPSESDRLCMLYGTACLDAAAGQYRNLLLSAYAAPCPTPSSP